MTPVAELEPVFLAGSTISRATLHNQEEVARKDIRVGDWVVIEKAGDVIPQVVKVDFKRRGEKSPCGICRRSVPFVRLGWSTWQEKWPFGVPTQTAADKISGESSTLLCKHAMDIEHMGEKVVEQLVERGLVQRISDIYRLDDFALAGLDGFKEKSIRNLLESIEASKKCSLARFIMALGIKSVGTEMS